MASGQVTVTAVSGSSSTSLSATLTVVPRTNFTVAMPAQPTTTSPQGTDGMGVETSPPSGAEGTLGQSAYSYAYDLGYSASILSGPNTGYRYVTGITVSSVYVYELNPGLTNTTDGFYVHQYGKCGFPSVADIVTGVQNHGYAATPSHYSKIAAALSASNPGVAVEGVVAPSQAGSIDDMAKGAATPAYQAAVNAGAAGGEPPTYLPSNINYYPYQPLPNGCN